jgi:two-component system response regulator RegA
MAGEEIRSVLIVDDDEAFRSRLQRAFLSRGWDAACAGDRVEALAQTRQQSPDLILVDLRMPDVDGLDLVAELRAIDDSNAIVVLTGYGSIATALTAVKRGANHYLSKPIDVDQIIAAFEELQAGEPEPSESRPAPTVPTLARVEWEHIQRVLVDCSGNISEAARVLGIHRRSLQRKLTKYPPSR